MIPDADKIEKRLLELQTRKDAVLMAASDIVRLAGRSITAMQVADKKKADALLSELKLRMSKLRKTEKGFEYHTLQSHQEYVEALVFYSIVTKHKIPSMADLGEGEAEYLLGVLDVVGELKRKAFEALRIDRLKDAEMYYDFMEEIYDSTYSMKFANSLVPDFRKKQDVARIQIEGLRGDLLFAKKMDGHR